MAAEQHGRFAVPGSAPPPYRYPPHPHHSQSQSPSQSRPQSHSQAQSQSQSQSQPQPQQSDPSSMKLTRGTSCVLCQQRKVRCDKNKPCANCVKANAECRVIPPQPPRRRKKRLQEKDLVERLRKYEGLLMQHGVKFDSISQEFKSDGQNLDDVDELENDFEGLKTSPEASASPSAASLADRPHGTWFSLHKEFRASEQLLHDSSDEDADGSNIHRAYDKMFDGNSDGFPFIIGGRQTSVTSEHPPTIHILQLWQIYIDNINPLLKITHVPSLQPQVIEATSRLEQAPKNIEALMFGIYLIAITSLEEAEVIKRFNEPKKELLGRFFMALQQALVNASFMRINDHLTLQAYLLYLFAVRWYVDPRQVFCLIGVAVRIAQRMGLHRDPAGYGLPPYEVEQRRRLWWTIVGYDRRIGEMTGSTVTALSSGGDCKLPLNVNDSDLHIEGKEMPTPHTGPTEMLFALTRIEIAMAVASNSNRDSFKMNPDKDMSSPQPGRPAGPTIRLAGQDTPPYTLEGFCAHIEGTYLTYCDPKIPLHFFTLTMTRQALCKMKIINFLVRNHNADTMPLKEVERDSLFLGAIQMVEYDNVVQSAESLKPFKWYAMHHFPFPAYMFLVQELRLRIMGPMVERAWEAIERNHELRGLLNNLHNPMHMAFGSIFVKSWLAHEEAQRKAGKDMTTPEFICVLRDRVEKRRIARMENRQDPSLEQAPVSFPRTQAGGSDAHSTPSTTTSPQNTAMMTPPPVDQTMAAAGRAGLAAGVQVGAAAAIVRSPIAASASPGDDSDSMDWSVLMAGYQDGGTFQPFGMPFSGFGPPMGGMGPGGMGGGPFGGPGGPGGGGGPFG